MLIVTGSLNGRSVSVTFVDGELGGDTDAVEGLREVALAWEGEAIGRQPGPFTVTAKDHLADPVSVAFLAGQLLEDVSIEGLKTEFDPEVVY